MKQMSPKIKVLIVEDDELIANHYKRILSKEPQIEFVGHAFSGYEGTLMAALYKPDVILMDIELEDKHSGLKATSQILEYLPHIKVVILTVDKTDDTIYQAFELGVTNYLLKNVDKETIIKSVKDAYYEKPSLHPNIAGKIIGEFQRIRKAEEAFLKHFHIFTKITPSEFEVLSLLMKGYNRQEICNIRHVEYSTLKSQIHSILKKFNKSSIKEVKSLLKDTQIMNLISNETEHH